VLRFSLVIAAFVFCFTQPALGLPAVIAVNDVDGDASITLSFLDSGITDDSQSWCEVRLVVLGVEYPLTEGDTCTIQVWEDDTIGDDLIWETTFLVTASEASVQLVDRVFDCSCALPDNEPGPIWEVFANADIDKEGSFFNDKPQTGNIEVIMVEDDTAEDDDSLSAAATLPLEVSLERVSRDEDWFVFVTNSPGFVEVSLAYFVGCGRLDATLFPDGEPPVLASDTSTGGRIIAGPLDVGTHAIQVFPRDPANFNFYDIIASADAVIFADGFEDHTTGAWSAISP